VALCKEAVNDAFRFIAENDHPYYVKEGWINLVEPYSSGTCNVAEGGTTVSGCAPASWASAMEGRMISIEDSRVHYKLSSFDGTDEFTFDGGAKWVDDAVASGSYVIYQDIYDFPADFRTVDRDVIEMNLLTGLEWVASPGEWFALKAANYSLAGRPRWACIAGNKLYLWPYDTDISVLPFMYYYYPAELSSDSTPMDFPDHGLTLVRRAIDYAVALQRKTDIDACMGRFLMEMERWELATKTTRGTFALGGASPPIEVKTYTIGADQP
jgi:hypothetical protein